MEEVLSTMAPRRKKWGLEECRASAANFTTRGEFQKGATSAYQTARVNGWLDDICAHMERKRVSQWTFEAVKAEASTLK